jgi:hypothetical protein
VPEESSRWNQEELESGLAQLKLLRAVTEIGTAALALALARAKALRKALLYLCFASALFSLLAFHGGNTRSNPVGVANFEPLPIAGGALYLGMAILELG